MSERYHPTAEQLELAHSMGKSLAAILPLSRLQGSQEESAEAWSALRELGVFGVTLPDAAGGGGLGATEEALIVFELGRRAVAASVLATVAATHLRGVPRTRCVAAGYRRGDRVVFVADSRAEWLLVRGASEAALFRVPAASQLLDARLWSSRLEQTDALDAPVALTEPRDRLALRLLDAAALAGLAQAALEMAVGYASLREQFGRPIGSFQAIKHACASMALSARCAHDQVCFAAVALDDRRDDAVLQVESALLVAGSAALESCAKNIQIHGGIGFSDEAAPHRLLKRARVQCELAGGLEPALERIAACPPALGTRG